MRYRRLIFAIVVITSMLLAAACKQVVKFDDVYTKVTEATLQAGDAIPTPEQDAVLTVNGKIGTSNTADAIVMDRATIEKVGLVEYTVQDPFADHAITYRGVLMRDLLALWQVPKNAETVQLTALNDYQVDIPVADFYQYPILYAMQADGVYMEPDYQGPAMLVFPVDDYQFDKITVRRRWIWQIKTIEIE